MLKAPDQYDTSVMIKVFDPLVHRNMLLQAWGSASVKSPSLTELNILVRTLASRGAECFRHSPMALHGDYRVLLASVGV